MPIGFQDFNSVDIFENSNIFVFAVIIVTLVGSAISVIGLSLDLIIHIGHCYASSWWLVGIIVTPIGFQGFISAVILKISMFCFCSNKYYIG